MDHYAKLVVVFLLAWTTSGHAGYAYPSPPPAAVASSALQTMWKTAANDSVVTGLIRSTAGPVVNVGGKAVVLPVAARLAANASLYAARGIHPLIIAGVVLAPVVYDWLTETGVTVIGDQPALSDPAVCTVGPCYQYSTGGMAWVSTQQQACNNWGYDYGNASYYYEQPVATETTGYTYGYGRCTGTLRYVSTGAYVTTNTADIYGSTATPSEPVYVPMTKEEFEQHIAPYMLPDTVPQVLPFPLPVDAPIANPSPGATPVSQPLRLPQGSPRPVPLTDPQKYETPVIDVVPKPTVDSPWRVELIPRVITTESPAELPESAPVPVDQPDPDASPENTPGLCEQYPDILACVKIELGTLDPVDVGNMDRNMMITKDSGYGPDTAACPAAKTAVVMGITLTVPFTMICDIAAAIRPLLIGFAWLSAALTFFGMGRKD